MSMATPSVSRVKGTGYSLINTPNKNEAQMGLFNQGAQGLQQGFPQILQQLMQLAQGGSPESWAQLEAPALRQFGELQGNIASRFSGMGSGARKSSGFQNAQSGAAADLAERLQANRLGLQNQATSQLMDLYQNLIGQDLSTQQFLPKKKSAWQEFLSSVVPGVSQGLGSFGSMGAGKWAGLY